MRQRGVTEKAFQATVVQAARLTGWTAFHVYDSRRCVPGFPDLVLIRPPRILFAELKTDAGRIRPEQQEWLDMLTACGQTATVWRPRDWDSIVAILQTEVRT